MQANAARATTSQGARASQPSPWRWLVSLLGLLALLAASSARAADATKVKRAKELFDAALALMDGGNPSQACPLLEQSQKLDPGMGTLYYLGRCYEKTGRLGSAYTVFDDVATEARKAGMADRESVASQAAAALESRVPRLRIVVPAKVAELPGLRIDRDDTKIHPAFFGRDVPVDLGEHVVKARADKKAVWERKVLLTREGVTVKIEIPMLGTPEAEGEAKIETEPPADSKASPEVTSGGESPPAKPADSADAAAPEAEGADTGEGWPIERTFAIGSGALAVAGAVVGAVFAAKASSQWDEALSHCVDEDKARCDAEAGDLSKTASTSADVATVGFVVGGATAVVAIVLLALDPAFSSADEPTSQETALRIWPAAPGASVGLSIGLEL